MHVLHVTYTLLLFRPTFRVCCRRLHATKVVTGIFGDACLLAVGLGVAADEEAADGRPPAASSSVWSSTESSGSGSSSHVSPSQSSVGVAVVARGLLLGCALASALLAALLAALALLFALAAGLAAQVPASVCVEVVRFRIVVIQTITASRTTAVITITVFILPLMMITNLYSAHAA
jgi:hypothetical protein